jgi:hypothetical protein
MISTCFITALIAQIFPLAIAIDCTPLARPLVGYDFVLGVTKCDGRTFFIQEITIGRAANTKDVVHALVNDLAGYEQLKTWSDGQRTAILISYDGKPLHRVTMASSTGIQPKFYWVPAHHVGRKAKK